MLCQCFHYRSLFFFLFLQWVVLGLCEKVCTSWKSFHVLQNVTWNHWICYPKNLHCLYREGATFKIGIWAWCWAPREFSSHLILPIVKGIHFGSCLALKRWQIFKSGALLWFNCANTNSFAVFVICLVLQFALHCHIGTLWLRVRCYTRWPQRHSVTEQALCVSPHKLANMLYLINHVHYGRIFKQPRTGLSYARHRAAPENQPFFVSCVMCQPVSPGQTCFLIQVTKLVKN